MQHHPTMRLSSFSNIRLVALLGAAIPTAGAILAGPALADPSPPSEAAACLVAPVTEQASSGIQGMAQLCWNPQGVRVNMHAENVTPGDAYTIWFVYFDQPSACKTTPCSGADTRGENPVGVISRMDGVVGDETGRTYFSGDFRDLRLSVGAEVHLPIFGHGPANADDNRYLARQLLTPQFPAFGAPMGGAAADGQVGRSVGAVIFTIP